GRRILEDCERLLRMVDNLLDATRLEEGGHQLAPAELALRGAAETGGAEIAERARLSSVTIAVEMPDDLKLTIDPTVLGTVLRNLLDNALKACVAGGGRSIALRGARTAHGVELAGADDGIGFPPEDAALIFEKFYRVGDELRRSMPGTGLGLYIVKRLVEQSGGAIAAQSGGAERRETRTVPLAEGRAEARRARHDPLAGARPMTSPGRILIVDDEAHLAEGIRENLEAEG